MAVQRILSEGIAHDIRRVARSLGKDTLTRSEYVSSGGIYSLYQIYDGGETWEGWCARAGVHTRKKEPVPDDVYFQRLRVAIGELGRSPKASERKKYGLNFSKRRYPTLAAFLRRAESEGIMPKSLVAAPPPPPPGREIEADWRTAPLGERTGAAPASQERTVIPPIPAGTRRKKWQRTNVVGFPYAPHDEQGVVALFAVLCADRRLPWEILELSGGKGIDATCWDRASGREVRLELKYILSKSNWNHDIRDVDHVVCWENRWADFPKSVTELRRVING